MSIDIVQIDPANKQHVRAYLDLPFRIYRDIPQWVPPLAMDARQVFDQRRYAFYEHSEAAFFLARDERGLARGRLAMLNNRNYNRHFNTATAHFCQFECEDDVAISAQLFEAGFAWACARGLNLVFGPKGFTAFDGFGLLAKGFEHRPAFGLPYNPPYYPALVEAAGFRPVGDSLSGYLSASTQLPDKIRQVAELVQARRGLRVASCKNRADLKRAVKHLYQLHNEVLVGVDGAPPITEAEVKVLADQMLWFADPKLIKIVLKVSDKPGEPDRPVGFLLAYPDISAALQRTGGRLFPLGWVHLLQELRRTRWININGAGMIPQYRGLGGTAVLFYEMYKSVHGSRYEHADVVQIAANNDRMHRELREVGVDFYKAHRMYERPLDA